MTTMQYDILKRVVDELARVLPGSKTEKVIPLDDGGLCFRFQARKKRFQLLVSPDRGLPRIHLIAHRQEASEHPSPFYLQVRKNVTGARFAGISVHGGDRIVEMRFERTVGGSLLIMELFAAKSNLILTDNNRKIEAVLHPAAPGESKRRVLLPGMMYEAPSPGGMTQKPVKPAGLNLPESSDASETAVNSAVEAWFDHLRVTRREAATRLRLSKTIERELSRVERRIDAVSQDLKNSEQSGLFRKRGEVLLANLGAISRGQVHCEVEDFDGAIVSIPLEPALSASENAERYFKKYKKAKAGNAVLRERLDAANSEADVLRVLLSDLHECTVPELDRITGLARERGLDAVAGKTTRPRRSAFSAPYRIVSFNGWDILIGKSAAGNDYITKTLAKPDDLWLHAEGMPGSHVLVRNPGKREVPAEVLRKAASLAAFHSKGNGSTRVPVAYTDAKYVKKPKGAKPGLVVLTQRRTIMATPEPS